MLLVTLRFIEIFAWAPAHIWWYWLGTAACFDQTDSVLNNSCKLLVRAECNVMHMCCAIAVPSKVRTAERYVQLGIVQAFLMRHLHATAKILYVRYLSCHICVPHSLFWLEPSWWSSFSRKFWYWSGMRRPAYRAISVKEFPLEKLLLYMHAHNQARRLKEACRACSMLPGSPGRHRGSICKAK